MQALAHHAHQYSAGPHSQLSPHDLMARSAPDVALRDVLTALASREWQPTSRSHAARGSRTWVVQ